MSERLSVQTAGRGTPYMTLVNGREVITDYLGPAALLDVLARNQARPLALSSADFNEDGVPDLVSGYASGTGGIINVTRGNADAIYPNTPEAQRHKAEGTFTAAPFLSPAKVYRLASAPDFLGAGDFNADGHWDIVAAQRGLAHLYWWRGNGQGDFSEPIKIDLDGDGVVTALITGEINQADGLTDVVVAISSAAGARLLVFEGPAGALQAQPETIALSAAADTLVLGQLDNDAAIDLAAAAGHELLAVYGRDRHLSLSEPRRARVPAARVEKRAFPFAIRSLALGAFSKLDWPELALLADNGLVRLLRPGATKAQEADLAQPLAAWQQEQVAGGKWPSAARLMRAKVSGLPGEDLVIIDAKGKQLHVLAGNKSSAQPLAARSLAAPSELQGGLASFNVVGEPVALLPMRLDVDALDDLVLCTTESTSPTVMLTAQDNKVPSAPAPLNGATGSANTYFVPSGGQAQLTLQQLGQHWPATTAVAQPGKPLSGLPGGVNPGVRWLPVHPALLRADVPRYTYYGRLSIQHWFLF